MQVNGRETPYLAPAPARSILSPPRRLAAHYFRQLTAERVFTRFERGRPVRSWQPRHDGERSEVLDTFVYAHADLHRLISMGFRLNEEVERVELVARRPSAEGTDLIPIVRSRWMA